MITADTRVFAVLGDPVSHSLSPTMHNAAFRAAGVDAVYLALPCAAEDLSGVIRTLVQGGGGGNVTVPHKRIAATAGAATSRVSRLGVANVFWSEQGEPRVGNTDTDGLLALLDSIGAPSGAAWCIVGTGGSARAAVGAALERGARVAIRSRDPERGRQFAEWAAGLGVGAAVAGECQVVINATPLGLRTGDPVPIELETLPVAAFVADLTYRSDGVSELVATAERRGIAAADGREMLLIQGAAAWQYWFPGVQVPTEVMRAALAGRMG